MAFLQDILGEKWDTHVKRSDGSIANYLGITIDPNLKKAEDERKRIALEKMMNSFAKKP